MMILRRLFTGHWWLAVVLFFVTLIIYAGSFDGELQYSWDDNRYIEENALIHNLTLENVVKIFTEPYFAARIPITIMGYGVQYAIWGVQPAGYFIINALMHALNVVLVFWFVYRLTDLREVAFIAALLFGVHPVNVESVAWVSQFKSVLSMFFFLLAWHTHMNADKNQIHWLVLAYILFALAIFSKQTAVGAVILFVLYDFWALRLHWSSLVVRNAPYAVVGLLGAVAIVTAHADGGGIKTHLTDNLFELMLLNLRIYWEYAVSLVAPFHLNNMYIYEMPDVLANLIPSLLGLGLMVGLLLFAFFQPLGRPLSLFAVVWSVVLILPTANIVPLAIQRADRYLYYPSVLIFMAVAIALVMLWQRLTRIEWRYVMVGAGAAIFAVFGFLTVQRVEVWQNTETLWADHLTDYPTSATGLLNKSVYYYRQSMFPQAYDTLSQLLAYYPAHYRGNRLMGLTFLNAGRYGEAEAFLERAAQIGGNQFDVPAQLGITYFQRGLEEFEAGEYLRALDYYNKALPLVIPAQAPIVMNNAGFTLFTMGRLQDAVDTYTLALQLSPRYTLAWTNLGNAYAQLGDNPKATESYRAALQIDPQNVAAQAGLAAVGGG